MDMREQKFGIEIEMTGITRQRAAEVMAVYFSSAASYDGGSYEVYSVRDAAGRRWKVMYDSSIEAQKKGGGYAGSEYKVEFVSPSVNMRISLSYKNSSGSSGMQVQWQERIQASMCISTRHPMMQGHCGTSPTSCTARKI